MRSKLKGFVFVAALSSALVATSATPSTAAAQATEPRQIDASPKGLIGLGLIGAELGLTIPALAGLRETWSLIVFPVVGGAGGALAGHFLLDNNGHVNASVAMLTVGLALIVPSVVLTLWATRYRPPEDGVERSNDDMEPLDADDEAARPTPPAHAGGGLLRIGRDGLQVGLPDVGVLPSYTLEELALFGGQQSTEVRFSLLSGRF
ncbi:MAG: hypothetical protein KF901_20770 [Myxococcales bacterium]|nr:hypothetical protein [Myxococcales bacterium]